MVVGASQLGAMNPYKKDWKVLPANPSFCMKMTKFSNDTFCGTRLERVDGQLLLLLNVVSPQCGQFVGDSEIDRKNVDSYH